VTMEADYVGKEVDNLFVVGYGIDFNERYRNLPQICYLIPKDQSK
jgi:hypoxanthine-guanine phosphoribosyltransferase